jgi:hypothetical protein
MENLIETSIISRAYTDPLLNLEFAMLRKREAEMYS